MVHEMACKRKENDEKMGLDIHHLQTALTFVFSQLEKPTTSKKLEPEVTSDDDFIYKKPLLKRFVTILTIGIIVS